VASASHKATTAGNHSGIAETARLTATRIECEILSPEKIRTETSIIQRQVIKIATFREKSSNFCENGLTSSVIWLTIPEI
jgi:hypothetical protein